MTRYVLRPYQEKAIEDIRASLRNHRRTILQAPTGSGKTVLTSYMMRRAAEKGLSSWFLVHRKELLDQTSKHLIDMEVPHGIIMAGHERTPEPVQVASVQTLVRRLDKLEPPHMVVVDEAHHATAMTYRKILGHCEGAWIIGLTATPSRTDGTGLGDIFEDIVTGPSVDELIEGGHLAPFRIYTPPTTVDLSGLRTRAGDWEKEGLEERMDTKAIIGDAIEHYRRLVAPGSCLIYCVSRKHARHVAANYQEAGLDAVYVAGDTPKPIRDAAIAGFRHGAPRIIVSVDLFGEGLDVPGLAAVQLLRPTQSLGLHLQQIGRALRPEQGKTHATVLDHVGNTFRHGFPDEDREWTLEGKKRRAGATEAAPNLLSCEECLAIFRVPPRQCPLCGWEPEARGREVQEIDGQLEEADRAERDRIRAMRAKRREQGRAQSLDDLVRLALQRKYKPAWAGILWAKRTGGNQSDSIRRAYSIAREMADGV